jgi:hypothetical protein
MGATPSLTSRLLLLAAAAPFLLGSLGTRTNFDERVLAAHNRERDQMAVPALNWDNQLASDAAGWARHLSRSGRFEHSPDTTDGEPQGENIWGGTPGYYVPESMVALWVAEKKNYKPGIFPATTRSGRVEDVSHYTQLVWRRTRKVGCAVNADGAEEILVCRYSTAGNVLGQRPL